MCSSRRKLKLLCWTWDELKGKWYLGDYELLVGRFKDRKTFYILLFDMVAGCIPIVGFLYLKALALWLRRKKGVEF
ncbi:MAG: hypothetical protein DRP08_01500 [Candidatus Aenigmatarchaeota archaeon]|nr:MAG: hypothetical protein DRP08_01500 [Candidatus Aenigmarchaeota archaeon]